ncbi:MAG: transcriptional repressor [Bacteroidales bacterium]|nr:transcriptional repressor [Bacteroidales bacterium]MDT8372662.1 transcriptional repressor [Bacteroidales bacterium]
MPNDDARLIVKQIFAEYLGSRSLRKTPERFSILDEIYSRDGHFDIESLFNYMKNKNYRVSRATLYNTIDLLIDCKLVTKHKFGRSQAQYEKTFRTGQHDHIIDTETGKVIEFSDPRINDIIRNACEENSFILHHYALYVFGIPDKSRKQKSRTRETGSSSGDSGASA